MRLISLERNCHFCYFANGLNVKNFLLLLRKFFCTPELIIHNLNYVYFKRFSPISFFTNLNLRLSHEIFTRGKMNKLLKN